MSTIKRIPISDFVKDLKAAEARHDGYIMGARGQEPKKWAVNSWWYEQYTDANQHKKALYWRENAQRVWDCNGLAEGIYEDHTGVNINTKARFNYAEWCAPKGTGSVPTEYRVPGTAVFIYSKSKGYITHVGYLVEPVKANYPSGDWWVIEARGVMYGVVRTKLSERGWNRWGQMSKYFDYGKEVVSDDVNELGKRTLKRGMSGADVKQMQMILITAGYSCGVYGADGEFGAGTERAVRAFQSDNKLDVDGIAGRRTLDALINASKEEPDEDKPDPAEVTYTVTGDSVYVRTAPSVAAGAIMGVVHKGDKLVGTGLAESCWRQVRMGDDMALGWISGKYVA